MLPPTYNTYYPKNVGLGPGSTNAQANICLRPWKADTSTQQTGGHSFHDLKNISRETIHKNASQAHVLTYAEP